MTSAAPVSFDAIGGPAWSLWRYLTREDSVREGVVVAQDDRTRMLERHRLVVSIIDVNSRQMRCDGAIAGLDIDRARLRRDMRGAERPAGACEELAAVDQRMRELTEERRKLAVEREWLDAALAEFDGANPHEAPTPSGTA
ncbi:hypothetical protein SAMN05444161_2792 [Rhizobiales bacterium GAS191]|jgi:hypothetical protein|nr:hypothetical protein SAMN05519103_01994 [Rhizobiales bacterium GAS113]SED22271.1 hypothetical protein SAMN05444161_2792 [Rhizobiales bacterium GAS191]